MQLHAIVKKLSNLATLGAAADSPAPDLAKKIV